MAGKHEYKGIITENHSIADGIFQMSIAANDTVNFIPGQFFMIDVGTTLRRAFAPFFSLKNHFTFAYAIVGEGTEHLSKTEVASNANVIAPLGNGYTIDKISGADATAILIGGGVGAPSLILLARVLRERGVKIFMSIGARSENKIIKEREFSEVADRLIIATDDGSRGFHGNAVSALSADQSIADEIAKAVNPPTVFACGPKPMLKAASIWANEKKFACQVSMEERMACGIGACMGCVVAVKNLSAAANGESKYQRVCEDGPVFDANVIDWDV